MIDRPADASTWREQTRHDILRLASWTGAWLATMALATFGPVWVANLISTDAEIGFLVLLIGITYHLGTVAGYWRYR